MRTLDQIASEHWPEYQGADFRALLAVKREVIADIVARMQRHGLTEEKIEQIVAEFWQENAH